MIEHVYRRAQAAASVDAVLVATDDARIRSAVVAFGGNAQMTAADHRSGTDRLAEAARDLKCDLIVNVQADEPLVAPSTIDLAVQVLSSNPEVPVSTIRCPVTSATELSDPNVVKVVVDTDGYALYFSRNTIPYQWNSDRATDGQLVYKHVGLYVYRRLFLLRLAELESTPLEQSEQLEQLRVLEYGYRIQTALITQDSVGVDTPEDLERVRRILSSGIS